MKNRIPRKQKKRSGKANPMILVYYINIGNLRNEDINQVVNALKMDNKKLGINSIQYYIPVRDQESKVECINPVLVDKNLYQQVANQLEETKKRLDEILKK